jgi:hypothetical protein
VKIIAQFPERVFRRATQDTPWCSTTYSYETLNRQTRTPDASEYGLRYEMYLRESDWCEWLYHKKMATIV